MIASVSYYCPLCTHYINVPAKYSFVSPALVEQRLKEHLETHTILEWMTRLYQLEQMVKRFGVDVPPKIGEVR